MNALIHNPWFWATIGITVFSAIASSMPAPDAKSSVGYRWLYGTLHTLSANIGNIVPLLRANGVAVQQANGASVPKAPQQ